MSYILPRFQAISLDHLFYFRAAIHLFKKELCENLKGTYFLQLFFQFLISIKFLRAAIIIFHLRENLNKCQLLFLGFQK